MEENKKEEKAWRFGVVGNIVESHTDENGNIYYGTKSFRPKAKVYLEGKNWDKGYGDTMAVIGLNRFGRYVTESVPNCLIENVRAQRIYKPHVLDMMDWLEKIEGWVWWGRTALDRKETELFVKAWNAK